MRSPRHIPFLSILFVTGLCPASVGSGVVRSMLYQLKQMIFGGTNTLILMFLLLQRAIMGMEAVCEQTLQLGWILLPFDALHVPS